MKKSLIGAVLTVLVAGSAFIWGFLANRNQIFPYRLMRGTALAVGLASHEADKRHMIEPRTTRPADLQGLPYAAATYDPNREAEGVILHKPEKAYPGFNLYPSKQRGEAYLLDMEGEVVYRWRYDLEPSVHVHVELLPKTGELLILNQEKGLQKIDRGSKVVWRALGPPHRPHHALHVSETGEIHVLSRRSVPMPEVHEEIETLEDLVLVLSPDGTVQQELSLYRLLRDSPFAYLIPEVSGRDFADAQHLDYQGSLDLLHPNHVEVLDGSSADESSLFTEGRLLVSLRHLNAVVLIDPGAEKVLWLWGPNHLILPHHSTLLDNGNLLIFDNGLEASRIVEMDPSTGRIVWTYGPEEHFFTRTRGSNQRLPNGNTLITESDPGYAFEVTPEGETVWEFAAPEIDSKGYRQAIWRLRRFAPEELLFLDPPS